MNFKTNWFLLWTSKNKTIYENCNFWRVIDFKLSGSYGLLFITERRTLAQMCAQQQFQKRSEIGLKIDFHHHLRISSPGIHVGVRTRIRQAPRNFIKPKNKGNEAKQKISNNFQGNKRFY